jgi:hypothetical protein
MMLYQYLRLKSVKWKGDKRMMNWKGFGRKQQWPNFKVLPDICLNGLRKTTKTSIRKAGLQAKIWNQDIPNKKQEC